MAISNHDRIGKALELLKSGFGPFVDREFMSIHKDRAETEAGRLSLRHLRRGAAPCRHAEL